MPSGIYKRTTEHLAKMKKYCFQKGQISWSKLHPELMPRGENHWQWKNGKCKDKDGYIYILQPNHPFCNNMGYVFEHRLIIEKQIKRFLLPKERCHHLNKIKTDNRPKNLMAFINQSIHQQFHGNPKKVKPSEIIFDGRKL